MPRLLYMKKKVNFGGIRRCFIHSNHQNIFDPNFIFNIDYWIEISIRKCIIHFHIVKLTFNIQKNSSRIWCSHLVILDSFLEYKKLNLPRAASDTNKNILTTHFRNNKQLYDKLISFHRSRSTKFVHYEWEKKIKLSENLC